MVKHQRRSHQRGIHSSELDDCTSESGSDESPTTPKSSNIPWPAHGAPMDHAIPHGQTIHRAQSFADFGQNMNQYGVQPYGHRHSLSTGPHDFHEQPVHEPQPNMHMLQRAASVPQHPYYVTEQNNPGVATMNTNPMPPHYQVPRQQVERIAIEIPYTAPGLTGSLQSSPSTFSASARSPSSQEAFYTHQPSIGATFALQAASNMEQHGAMVQYPQQIQQPVQPPQQAMSQSVSQGPPQPPAMAPDQEQYQRAQPPSQEQWYSGVPYQSPVAIEVPAMVQMPNYATAAFDHWGEVKLEFETNGMQMPSARIEQM